MPTTLPIDGQTREAPPLAFRASFQPASVNTEKRTVDLVWTTGASVPRRDWDGDYNEELSLDPKHVRMNRLNNGAPFLANHDGYDVRSILGVIVSGSARLTSEGGVATVRFPSDGISPDADQMFRLIQDGIAQHVSVGYRVHKFEKTEGGDGKTPTFRATDWEPYEISAVAMGADDGAGFRSLTRSNTTMADKTVNAPEVVPAAETEATRQAELKAASETAAKAERERAAGIRKHVRGAKLDEDFAERLVSSGVSADQARVTILDEIATRSEQFGPDQNGQRVRIEITDDQHDKFLRGATAACLVRGGVDSVIETAMKQPTVAKVLRGTETDPGEFRSMSLVDFARMCLERRGVKTSGKTPENLVREALEYRGGMSSTSDFSVLLENVMYKILLGFYATTPDTWTRFCKVDSVQDFRPSNRYRLGSFGVLDQINEEGEFKNKSIPDGEKRTISVLDYGNIIALTRKAIINDDMGALVDIAGRFGRSAALSIEVAVYALLAQNSGLGPTMDDSLPLFDAGHGNISTGAALTVAGIDADRVLMKSQKDPSGNEYLDLVPSALLVPASLGATAKVVNSAPYEPTANQFQKPNSVAGLFRDVVDTARITGTRRYLFSDPNVSAALVVAFLNGQRTPYMEQRVSWRADGIEWKLRHDFKAQAFDYRGCVTNAGV